CFELSEEEEGIHLDEDVVPDLALNAEACGRSEQLSSSAKLHCVGGQCVVGLATKPGVVSRREIDGYPLEPGKRRRRVERRMKPANGQSKVRGALPVQSHGHVARKGELSEQTGIVQRGVERCSALIEVDDSNRVHLQADEIVVGSGKNRSDLSEYQQAATS